MNSHTNLYYSVLKLHMDEKKRAYIKRFNDCKTVNEFVNICINIIDYSIGVNSDYRKELTILQVEKLDSLLTVARQAIGFSEFIIYESPEQIVRKIYDEFEKKYDESKNFLHRLADFINSFFKKSDTTTQMDESKIRSISIDSENIVNYLYKIIDDIDCTICTTESIPIVKIPEKKLDHNILKTFHGILSSLNINRTEIPGKLISQLEEIEELLGEYGIDVIWEVSKCSNNEYFISQVLRNIRDRKVIKPCFVKGDQILVKGIVAIPYEKEEGAE